MATKFHKILSSQIVVLGIGEKKCTEGSRNTPFFGKWSPYSLDHGAEVREERLELRILHTSGQVGDVHLGAGPQLCQAVPRPGRRG